MATLQHTLKSHEIISTFYTKKTLCKLCCKPKGGVPTEDKNNIVYKIDCSNCEAVYFGESKHSLKLHSDKPNRSVRNCACDRNEIAKHCGKHITTLTGIRRKLLIGNAG